LRVTSDEAENDLRGIVLASLVFGLLMEALDEGPFSLMQAGLTALAFGVACTALTVGLRYVKRRRAARNAERSNPLF
jgi:hypothetical protein